MKTSRVAITGVDGTGKTTVVRELQEMYRNRPRELVAFRAPQYHEDPDLPYARLSAVIDGLSVEADRRGDSGLKAAALFLSMTLYGDVERHLVSAYRPRVLVAERQCVLDSLAYARFYLPLLRRAGAASIPLPEELRTWLAVVALREPALDLAGGGLSGFIAQLFSGPADAVVPRLLRVFNAELPDRILILTAAPDELARRLASKSGAPAELHEKAETLSALLAGLRESAALLRALRPNLVIDELDTTGLSPDEVAQKVVASFWA